MIRSITISAVAWLALLHGPPPAASCWGQDLAVPQAGTFVERNAETGRIQVRIPIQDGKVAWEDVLRAVLQAGHLDDRALRQKFPSGSLDLNRSYSRYALLAVNIALAPDMHLQRISRSGEPAHLLVTIDEGALQQRARRVQKRIRDKVTDGQLREDAYGLHLLPAWDQTAENLPLVIVVHGFDSAAHRFDSFAQALREAGFPSATYSYPDDQPISDSATQLSSDLKQLARDFPHRSLALVTHSMGGLVARAVLEQPELDPKNVTTLIMIAPPTHGSLLAHFAFGTDLIDHLVWEDKPEDVSRFYAAVEDGLSEARRDLKLDSPFLRQLNARPRNPRVKYSILLGTGGHLNRQQVGRLREALQAAQNESQLAALFLPQIDAALGDLDEVVRGKGDGVVAVKRGRLEGVDDVELAEFSHLEVLQSPEAFGDAEVFQAILKRLRH